METHSTTTVDPAFKSMAMGFTVPRRIAFMGIQDDNSNYNKLQYCPAGCIVAG
jgi:hypothetical protein